MHASGSDTNRLEAELARCHRLAGKLGVPLLASGEAGQEAQGAHFTMLYDDEGRLALGQPGSGFTPLAVSPVMHTTIATYVWLLQMHTSYMYGTGKCASAW